MRLQVHDHHELTPPILPIYNRTPDRDYRRQVHFVIDSLFGFDRVLLLPQVHELEYVYHLERQCNSQSRGSIWSFWQCDRLVVYLNWVIGRFFDVVS